MTYKQQKCISHSCGGCKSDKGANTVGFWRGLPSRLQTADLLCPHIGESTERKQALCDPYKDTNPIHGDSTLMTSSILITSGRPHLLILSYWGVGFQHEFWENTNIQSVGETHSLMGEHQELLWQLLVLSGDTALKNLFSVRPCLS